MLLSEIHEAPALAAITCFATHGCGIALIWGGDNSSKSIDKTRLTCPMVRTERVLISAPWENGIECIGTQ